MSGAVTRHYLPRTASRGKLPTVRDALIHLVRGHSGITTTDLAAKIGKTTAQTASHLSKLLAYGYVLKQSHRATGRSAHEFCTWSAPE